MKNGERKQEVETIVRKAFDEALDKQPRGLYPVTMRAGWIQSPIGAMLAVGNDAHLFLLLFMEPANTERKIAQIQKRLKACLEMGECGSIASIRKELGEYFAGGLREFRTPLRLTGSAFQVAVWEELRRVPYGATVSYAEVAERLDKPSAFRAVALANAQNLLHLIVPCHRVINSDGGLGGYAAGLYRKKWLLEFEKDTLARSD